MPPYPFPYTGKVFKFSAISQSRLDTCHPLLIQLFTEVIKHRDCSIAEGARTNERQAQLLRENKTQLGPGKSKHNLNAERPWSLAVDVVPYPEKYTSIPAMVEFGWMVVGMAYGMGIPLRWGGDWNMNWDIKDNWNDLPHFELLGVYQKEPDQ